jgi:hypothetical protein
MRRPGSCTGCNVPPEELARLPEAVRSHRGLSYYLYTVRVGPRRKEVTIRAPDFQMALAVANPGPAAPVVLAVAVDIYTATWARPRWSAPGWRTWRRCSKRERSQ